MPRGRKLTPRMVSEADRTQLQVVTNSTTVPLAATVRPHDLARAEAITNIAVALQIGASLQAVGDGRKHYLNGSIQVLHDELRPGLPRTYYDKRVAG